MDLHATNTALDDLDARLRRVERVLKGRTSVPTIDLLTPNDISRRYRTSRNTVMKAIKTGKLAAVHRYVGHAKSTWYVRVEDADAYFLAPATTLTA
jgi:hypothetical protein